MVLKLLYAAMECQETLQSQILKEATLLKAGGCSEHVTETRDAIRSRVERLNRGQWQRKQ